MRHLTKTDPDPRVRRRAQAVLLGEDGETLAQVARIFHTAAPRVRVWRTRFVAEGRTGLVDRARRGRPPKLDAADVAFLSTVLEQQSAGVRPARHGLERPRRAGAPPAGARGPSRCASTRCIGRGVYTVHRAIQALGYRYRRPRHDLTHRQNADAVAAAKQVLDWLPQKRLLSPDDSLWSTWTNVKSTPTPTCTWQRSGGTKGIR